MERDQPDTWLTLDQVREKLPKAKWSHNRVLEEVDVAVETGNDPSEFWAKARNDQAYIIARFRVRRTMEAFEIERDKKKPNG